MELVTRRVAEANSLKRYFTGEPCKHGHVSERLVRSCVCISCKQAAEQAYYKANAAKKRELTKEYRLRNPELARARVRACAKANPEVARIWTSENREKIRASVRKWDKAHQGRKNAIGAKRRAAQIRRTPAWTNADDLSVIYAAAEVAKVMWPDTEVDHIIPLQGKYVSGLHVPLNLQIIPLFHNRSKGNVFHP